MKKIYSMLLLLALFLCLFPLGTEAKDLTPAVSDNCGEQSYTMWASPVYSYLVDSGNETMTRVECINDTVYIEQFSVNGELQSQRTIDCELPLFGGFYAGKDYYFLVFGQTNRNEDNNCEVIRVVKYTKNWERVDMAGLRGANTTVPFDAGSLRMAQCGDMLYIRTCHEMYQSDDGYNHQANLTFSVRISDMTITDQFSDVMNLEYGYVSHSFNQFIAVDGTDLLAVDHGDAYPRSVVLGKYDTPAGGSTFTGYYDSTDVLEISGSTGNNYTGVSVGGFEVSETAYLVAGNSVDQSNPNSVTRNIFVSSTPKKGFPQAETTLRQITNYPENEDSDISTPQLVKIDSNRFLLLWTTDHSMSYVMLNGEGAPTTEIYQIDALLSDCQPILVDGMITWYVTLESSPVFFYIDPDEPQNVLYNFSNLDDMNPFVDITKDQYYYEPAIWAAVNGITTGVDDTHFAPDQPCTRGQVVTFLWRFAGQPEPKTVGCPFVDVPGDAYYYKAVLWAAENGITSGMDATHFAPTATVTRAQFVTFLYRFRENPDVSGSNPFADVHTGDYYHDAVLWAAQNGITTGIDATHFAPAQSCIRGQVVTFLFRVLNN